MVNDREFVLPLPRGKALSLRPPACVMGALDIPLDAAGDAARAIAWAIERGASLLVEGATILDIGGAFARNAEPSCVVPVISALSAAVTAPICLRTANAAAAAAALEHGAAIINDVWGLHRDREMARVAAAAGAAVILSHNRDAIDADLDIVADIIAFLSRSIDMALSAGLDLGRLIVDPGIGVGKTASQDIECVRRLNELKVLDCPILLGPSRATTLEAPTEAQTPAQRAAASVALSVAGVMNGAVILRTHDVATQVNALQVLRVILP